MSKLMIVVGSVRPVRAGLPVAEWVRGVADAHEHFEVDFVDLKELALPFMDEVQHPAKKQYTQPHTIAWSERVDVAEVFIFVSPEYNHSYSPALKNALDYLMAERKHKPVVLVKTSHSVEIDYVSKRIVDEVFTPEGNHEAALSHQLDDLRQLSGALSTLR